MKDQKDVASDIIDTVINERREQLKPILDFDKVKFLITEAGRIANEKGFDEDFRTKGKLALIVSELGEAMEADRTSKYSQMEVFEHVMEGEANYAVTFAYINDKLEKLIEDHEGAYLLPNGDRVFFPEEVDIQLFQVFNGKDVELANDPKLAEAYFVEAYKHFVKDTFETELAGTLVRIGHFMHHHKIVPFVSDKYVLPLKDSYFDEYVMDLIAMCTSTYGGFIQSETDVINYSISSLLVNTLTTGVIWNFDIWKHIEWELKYFATRPPKHGKKY